MLMSDFNTLVSFISNFAQATGINIPGMGGDKGDIGDDITSTINNTASFNSNSLRYRVKDLIAQYPILISESLSNKSLMLTTRTFEHEYVNMLALLINNDSIASSDTSSSKFLSNYHNNINNDNTSMGISYNTTGRSESFSVKNFEEANKELLLPIKLSEDTINSMSVNSYTRKILDESGYSKTPSKEDVEKEVKRRMDENPNLDEEQVREDVKRDLNVGFGSNISTTGKDSGISTIDIKKTNDLVPTTVTVDLTFPVGSTAVTKKIMFGVKCVAHPLKADDIEYYLPTAIHRSSPWARMIQWTTGEIKFFKDLVLSVDEMKKTAIKNNDRNGFWWRKLQTLSATAKGNAFFKRALNGNKDIQTFIPITTMVISKENVDNIKNKTGIDILSKPAFASKIVKNFFLMTFAIIDESIETLYLFNEQTTDYDSYSFSSLDRQTKQNNMDIKDIYKIFK